MEHPNSKGCRFINPYERSRLGQFSIIETKDSIKFFIRWVFDSLPMIQSCLDKSIFLIHLSRWLDLSSYQNKVLVHIVKATPDKACEWDRHAQCPYVNVEFDVTWCVIRIFFCLWIEASVRSLSLILLPKHRINNDVKRSAGGIKAGEIAFST